MNKGMAVSRKRIHAGEDVQGNQSGGDMVRKHEDQCRNPQGKGYRNPEEGKDDKEAKGQVKHDLILLASR